MAYQEKYNFTFIPTGLSEVHLVEIWQDTGDVVVAEEVKTGSPPFVVQLPDMDNKFKTVRGTGCIINLLSDTDMKFFDGLYHVDPKEFLIYHYIDSVLNWVGYLNPEMFTEPYDQSENYIIQTTGNDGFNLMDRLFFNESDSSQFKGMKSEWELLQIVFGKIGLPYTDIKISLSTTFADFTGGADVTILHESYIDSANFYDEDEKPMTLRGVIESILKPYGAFIMQSNGSVYISDVNTMAAGGSVTYQVFNASSYAYIEDQVEVNEKTVVSIGYLGTGQQIEISGGTNRQTVTYSPYPTKTITEELLVRPEEFAVVPPSFSTKDGYFFRTLEDHFFYDVNSPADFEESYASILSDEHFVYLRSPKTTPDYTVLEFNDLGSIFLNLEASRLNDVTDLVAFLRRYNDGVAILISGSVLTKTTDNPYAPYSQAERDANADRVVQTQLTYSAAIGEGIDFKFYEKSTESWVSSIGIVNTINIQNEGGDAVSNKWTEFSEIMPIRIFGAETVITGNLGFFIFSDTYTRIVGRELELNADVFQEAWVKDLKISLINIDGSEISDKDFEYIGQLDKTFLEEGQKVELTTGTSGQYVDRGRICWFDGTDYISITEWTRAGQTFKIEELLLGSISSNYRVGFVTLSNMNLKGSFTPMNVLTDIFVGSRIFMVNAISMDYYNNRFTTKLVEIKEDELVIVKE